MPQQVSSHLGKNTHTLKQKIMFYVIVNPDYLGKECVYLLDAIQLLQPWNQINMITLTSCPATILCRTCTTTTENSALLRDADIERHFVQFTIDTTEGVVHTWHRFQLLLGFLHDCLKIPQYFCEFTVALWGALGHSLGNTVFTLKKLYQHTETVCPWLSPVCMCVYKLINKTHTSSYMNKNA